jgi:hypothetical protein
MLIQPGHPTISTVRGIPWVRNGGLIYIIYQILNCLEHGDQPRGWHNENNRLYEAQLNLSREGSKI